MTTVAQIEFAGKVSQIALLMNKANYCKLIIMIIILLMQPNYLRNSIAWVQTKILLKFLLKILKMTVQLRFVMIN